MEGDSDNSLKDYIVPKDKVKEIKAHFVWILARSEKLAIQRKYIGSKIHGWNKDGGHWEIVKNFLGALGLTVEGKRADAASITLLRPGAEEDVQHVASRLGQWMGLDDPATAALAAKLQKAAINTSWDKTTFNFVLDSVDTTGMGSASRVHVTE